MVIYKLLGGVLIVASSLTVSIEGRKYEKRRLSQIGAYIELLGYVKNQIECYLLPIDKIIDTADADLLLRCGISKQRLGRAGGALLIPQSVYHGSRLPELLERFSREFGNAYREEQLHACERYIAEMNNEYTRLSQKESKESRLRLTLLVGASLSLILMLV